MLPLFRSLNLRIPSLARIQTVPLHQVPKRGLACCSKPSDMASQCPDQQTVRRYLQQSHERIFENNRKWVASKKEADPAFFDKLASGQSPEYLY